MTLIKPNFPTLQQRENFEPNRRKPMCQNLEGRDAIMDERARNEQASSQSSLKKESESLSSTDSAEHVLTLTSTTRLTPTQLSGCFLRALVFLLVFACWSCISFSISVWTASSSNPSGYNVNIVPQSYFRCTPSFCYSASVSIRKPEGFLPTYSSRPTTWIPPILKICRKNNKTFGWDSVSNGRRYEVMCSDASIQASTDVSIDGGEAVRSCLAKCILDNDECDEVLYLVDRSFESNCVFQHNNERPVFEAGDRVLATRRLKI